MRPYRGRMVTLSLIAAVEITLGLLAPWPLKLVVDNVLGRTSAAGGPGAAPAGRAPAAAPSRCSSSSSPGACFCRSVTQVVAMANTQLQVDTGQRMVYALRSRLLAHMQALSLRHHVVTRTADSVYRLEADAYCMNDLVMGGFFGLFTSVITLSAMFVVLLRLDSSLALLSLAVVPFLCSSACATTRSA